jgi:hypothetical protein
MPDCKTCRPSNLDYIAFHELANAHVAAGTDSIQCPECGLYRWPWEFPEPDFCGATGLGWTHTGRTWFLQRTGERAAVGVILHGGLSGHFTAWRNVGDTCEQVHGGTLADCARALVNSVQGER